MSKKSELKLPVVRKFDQIKFGSEIDLIDFMHILSPRDKKTHVHANLISYLYSGEFDKAIEVTKELVNLEED